jgi:hypothetical protein
MPGSFRDLSYQFVFHFRLNLSSLSKEVIRRVLSWGIWYDIQNNSVQDLQFFVAILHVNVVNLFLLDSVLKRSLKSNFKSIFCPTLHNWHSSGSSIVREFDSFQIESILLKWAAKSQVMNAVLVRFVLNSFVPTTVVETNLIVLKCRKST